MYRFWISDCGFWIERRMPAQPKSKIQNRKSKMSSVSRVPEPALPALRRVQVIDLFDPHARHGPHQHLRDAHAALDREGLLAEVDHRDLHFAAVVAVDRAGRVDHRDAVAGRQPAARPDLRLV